MIPIESEAPVSDGSVPLRNHRHEAFSRELVAADGDACKAYEAAGYRPHRGNAARLAQQDDVHARYKFLALKAAELAGVHLGRILTEQSRIAFANMADYVSIHNGLPVIDLTRLTRDQAAAIQEFTVDTERKMTPEGEEINHLEVTRVRFKLHDKVGTLKDLRSYCAADAPTTVRLTGKDDKPLIPDASSEFEVARRIAFVFAMAERALPPE